jgi:asparagine synthase (glutamine-hydrolysing)
VPIARWLREDLREYMEGIVLSPESLGRGIFREEAVRRLVEEHVRSQTDHSSRLWALLVLELWQREFIG